VPQPFVGFLLQRFPLAEIAHPLEPLCSRVVIHRRAGPPSSRPYCRWFPRRPRLRALAWFPHRLWAPFPRSPKGTLPGHSGSELRNSLHSASFTHFEALILLRIRSRRPELPRADGRFSPGFSPL